ncbi:MAG: D-alanyl-D-alanine endopeptidase [Burkholderiales bacterium]|nr:D-alanyl-D-alanine endopeptidase [Burkholderiales bacterium]
MRCRLFLALASLVPALAAAQVSDPVIITGAPVADSASVEQRQQQLDFVASPSTVSGDDLDLVAASAVVIDQEDGSLLYAKNTQAVMPIASITKLMTAMVVLDAGLPLDESITITSEDVDRLKGTSSRLRPGLRLSRREMLRLALMSSENRAASALSRHYPGGARAFIGAMNQKARQLEMQDTHFVDATGLNPNNVSTALDLARMVNASYNYSLIRDFTTTESVRLAVHDRRRARAMAFQNSNALVRSGTWDIGLSKTGYISEAGRCLVMQARIAAKPVIIVLLDSLGKVTRIADANRIKQWVETLDLTPAAASPRARMM